MRNALSLMVNMELMHTLEISKTDLCAICGYQSTHLLNKRKSPSPLLKVTPYHLQACTFVKATCSKTPFELSQTSLRAYKLCLVAHTHFVNNIQVHKYCYDGTLDCCHAFIIVDCGCHQAMITKSWSACNEFKDIIGKISFQISQGKIIVGMIGCVIGNNQ